MSTATPPEIKSGRPVTPQILAASRLRPVRRRGESSRSARLLSHGILIVASLIALFPVAWLVYLSLGPDKDDYLHPGGIWSKMSLTNYSVSAFFYVMQKNLVTGLTAGETKG